LQKITIAHRVGGELRGAGAPEWGAPFGGVTVDSGHDLLDNVDMPRERFLGEFEQMVLLAVVRLGDEAYGASVFDEIERRTGRAVSRGGLYVTIDRLVDKGLLEARMSRPTSERGGRARRMLRVSAEGVAELRKARAAFQSLWQGLDAILGKG